MKPKKLNEFKADRLKILILGESGVGKTSLVKTLKGRTLIISAESGLLSVAGCSAMVLSVNEDDDGNPLPLGKARIMRLGEIYKYLLTEEAKKEYENIFIDSLSEISESMFDALKEEFPDRKDSIVMWGENLSRMRYMIKLFRDLPDYNVIFTCLPKIDKDDNGKRYLGPDLNGKIADKVTALFDEVFYLYATQEVNTVGEYSGKMKRKILTGKTDFINCKDRSGALELYEEDDLGVIVEKISTKIEKNKESK